MSAARARIPRNPDGTARPTYIYKGPIKLGIAGPMLRGGVQLRWEPEPRVEFEVSGKAGFDEQVLVGEWAADGVPIFITNGRELRGRPDAWDYWDDCLTMRGAVDSVAFGSPVVKRMRAQIVNLPMDNRPRLTEMRGQGWSLKIKDLSNPDWQESGFYITGTLVVEREDGAAFRTEDGLAVLEAFDYFATLAQGSWATHALPIGTGPAGKIAWERWSVGRVDRHGVGDGWATQFQESVTALSAMWPGFIGKWDDAEWRPTMRTLATLLAEATAHTDGEAALLIIDVVLELLSWAVVVRDRDMLSAEGHDRLQGSDRLRLLLSLAEMDRRMPSALTELASTTNRMRWLDGPHAITEIRDAVVHPRKRSVLREVSPRAIDEAQLLARDYAHGGIVSLLGAKGWVPWSDRWLTPRQAMSRTAQSS